MELCRDELPGDREGDSTTCLGQGRVTMSTLQGQAQGDLSQDKNFQEGQFLVWGHIPLVPAQQSPLSMGCSEPGALPILAQSRGAGCDPSSLSCSSAMHSWGSLAGL